MESETDIQIRILYDSSFERQVQGSDRPHNPLVNFNITCGGETLSGPELGYVDGYALNVLGELLDAMDDIQRGERCIVTAPEDSVRFVFEPSDGAVVFTICVRPECVEDTDDLVNEVEKQVVVSKSALTNEIMRESHKYLHNLETNSPKLLECSQIREFERKLQKFEDER